MRVVFYTGASWDAHGLRVDRGRSEALADPRPCGVRDHAAFREASFRGLIALSWICLIAFSRLVLGVHWPTDVLAAACIGAVLPLAISVALELVHASFRNIK